jgi:WD40 repeat protein
VLPASLDNAPSIPDHELIKRIGRGGYGEVWLARNRTTHALRAVKIIFRHEFDDERPYQREFEGLLKFEPISRSHPSQLAVLHIGRDAAAGCFYYVMELADAVDEEDAGSEMEAGGKSPTLAPVSIPPTSNSHLLSPKQYTPRTLRSELRRRGVLPVAECVELARQLAIALAHLHGHSLIHRDVKPANIVYAGGVPKLADIGLVTQAGDGQSIVGTEGYMPPEGPGTPAGDLFSLGRVLYEAATGMDRREFPKLPPNLCERADAAEMIEFNEILLKLGAADASRRYRTAEELQSDLALLQAGRSMKRVRRLERQLAWARRSALTGVALLVLAASLVWVQLTRTRQAERERAFSDQHARELRQNLYAADMKTAHIALQENNRSRARELLDRHVPKRGEEDIRGFEWHYLSHLKDGDPAQRLQNSEHLVTDVVFSPDGSWLAVADMSRRIGLWKPRAGMTMQQNAIWESGGPPHMEHVAWLTNSSPRFGANSLVFSPDGKLLVSAGAETINIWSIEDRALVQQLSTSDVRGRYDERSYNSAAFSPDGSRMAFRPGTNRSAVAILDTATWETLAEIHGPEADPWRFLRWLPDGNRLLLAGREEMEIWDADARIKLLGWREPQIIDAIDVSPSGREIAITGMNRAVRVAASDSGKILSAFQADGYFVRSIAFSPDGRRVAVGADFQSVQVFDWQTGRLLKVLKGHLRRISTLAFDPTGRFLASGSWDGTARLWPLNPPPERNRLEGACWPVAFLDGGAGLLTYSYRDHLQIWDVRTATLRETVRLPDDHRVFYQAYPALSHDGRTLSFGLEDGSVQLWDWPARKTTRRLISTNGMIDAWVIGPDNSFAALIVNDQMVLQDLVTGKEEAYFPDSVPPLALSPDGRIVAVAAANASVHFLDVASRRTRIANTKPDFSGGNPYSIFSMAFAWDSRTLVTGSFDDRLWFFDSGAGNSLGFLQLKVPARGPAFSPDGRTLAIVGADDTLRLWHVPTRREMLALPLSGPLRRPIVFSPDGTVLAVGAGLEGGPSARLDTRAKGMSYWSSLYAKGDPPSVWLWRAPRAREEVNPARRN